ncbi:hypothetical protein LguiB_032647 [Lonicera macranthoides]
MQFLMGLNDTYSAIRGQILLMQPLPPIGKIYSMVLQEEQQRDITISREVMMTTHARKQGGGNAQLKGRAKLHCTHCNGTNHTVDKCYYLHGFSSGHKYNKKADNGDAKKSNRSMANNVHTEAPSLTQEQYLKLLNLLDNNSAESMDQPRANATGPGNEEDDWFGEAA